MLVTHFYTYVLRIIHFRVLVKGNDFKKEAKFPKKKL